MLVYCSMLRDFIYFVLLRLFEIISEMKQWENP